MRLWHVLIGLMVLLMVSPAVWGEQKSSLSLQKVFSFIEQGEFVDLTHAFSPSVPIPEGLPKAKREAIYGGAVQIFTHAGQYGTHLDAPGHFHKGMRLVDAIPAREFILPGCVIDISKKAQSDHDYQLQLEDIMQWEGSHGPIPSGSIVLLRTGWSKRWPDPDAFFNVDENGQKHYPGWGREALEHLIEKRNVRAIAHETPDTDSGITCGPETGWPLEDYVLKNDIWQVENLRIPEDGLPSKNFIVFVGVPKGKDATGFPVRVIAVVPAK